MIDIRKLKELVKLMVENDLGELDLRDQQETVTIKRGIGSGAASAGGVTPAQLAALASGLSGGAAENANGRVETEGAAAGAAAEAGEGEGVPDGLVALESPMVGTFYSSPNPDSDPFVAAGASISEGSVVCLIEAMKVFNEIKAERSGTVERVLVQNGEAVEFGQKLFLVRPA